MKHNRIKLEIACLFINEKWQHIGKRRKIELEIATFLDTTCTLTIHPRHSRRALYVNWRTDSRTKEGYKKEGTTRGWRNDDKNYGTSLWAIYNTLSINVTQHLHPTSMLFFRGKIFCAGEEIVASNFSDDLTTQRKTCDLDVSFE